MAYRNNQESPVFVAFSGKVFAMERASGKRLWKHAMSTTRHIGLVVTGARVYALGPELVCLDALDGRVIWSWPETSGYETLFVHDGLVVVGGSTGEVSCFNAEDGVVLWEDSFD